MLDLVKELLANIAIITSGLFVYSQLTKDKPLNRHSSFLRKMFVGLTGGMLATVLMTYSLRLDEALLDLRFIPVIILVYYGGAIPALFSMIPIIIGRFLIEVSEAAFYSPILLILVVLLGLLITKLPVSQLVKVFLMISSTFFWFSFLLIEVNMETNELLSVLAFFACMSYIAGFLAFYTIDYVRNAQKIMREYRKAALTDPLTGLHNIRQFDQLFNSWSKQAQLSKSSLAILFIDIDHFKKVNDTYGHPEGDIVLKTLSQLIEKEVRSDDIVSRNGGEEFTVLLRTISLSQSMQLAERIRQLVERTPFALSNGTKISITVSIGFAHYPETTACGDRILKDADAALYVAKNSGRNRVVKATGVTLFSPGKEDEK
ncbi:diguanylate cyclase [Paenalkalicoccus suaedae]|uniref:Diguanylate cyclase n=1 Tax=Paenalkalicoccus suaedae TaxID=2592382 RepID=A0A859FC53_9BACI|nr:GGDEF domain-containing protein [Paenalkalicoccus suaedae]QKS70352.1 diguanylate cyclase [Paenalkalicoccus suaedae]